MKSTAYRCLDYLLDSYNYKPSDLFDKDEINTVLNGGEIKAYRGREAWDILEKKIDDTIEKDGRHDEQMWEYDYMSKIEGQAVSEGDFADLIADTFTEWIRKHTEKPEEKKPEQEAEIPSHKMQSSIKVVRIITIKGETVDIPVDRFNAFVEEIKKEQAKIFSPEERKILKDSIWNDRVLDLLEEFCEKNPDIYDWKSHELPHDMAFDNVRFLTTCVWVSADGMVFQDLTNASIYYQTDVEYIFATENQKVKIYERNSTSACFDCLRFKDCEGKDVCLIRVYRSDFCAEHGVKDWNDMSEETKKIQTLHRFADFINTVRYANEYLKKLSGSVFMKKLPAKN